MLLPARLRISKTKIIEVVVLRSRRMHSKTKPSTVEYSLVHSTVRVPDEHLNHVWVISFSPSCTQNSKVQNPHPTNAPLRTTTEIATPNGLIKIGQVNKLSRFYFISELWYSTVQYSTVQYSTREQETDTPVHREEMEILFSD